MLKKLLTGMFLLTFFKSSIAGMILGGSDLLSASDRTQLELWLNDGPINLTNIYDKKSGDTSYDFHAAVDGMGPTITVLEIFNDEQVTIIGGYNQVSWASDNRYTTADTNLPLSFLFNLNTGIKYELNRIRYNSFNRDIFGPTFGGGHDLYIDHSLNGGSTRIGNSYGNSGSSTREAYQIQFAGSDNEWTVGSLEVFAVSEGIADIPETGSIMLIGIGLLGMFYVRKIN